MTVALAMDDDPKRNPRLMTEEEVCQYLRVSREAILKFRRDSVNPIPCGRAGRRYLYVKDRVDRWLERNQERERRRP